MKRFLIIPLLAMVLLSSCSSGTASSLDDQSSEKATVVIIIPTETPAPPTVEVPTATATTAPPEITQPESIDISAPEAGTSISNPMSIIGMADSSDSQSLTARMTALDGTELAKTSLQIKADPGTRAGFSGDLSFTPGENQDALLQVYSTSAEGGILQHLNSSLVKLVSSSNSTDAVSLGSETIEIDSVQIISNNNKLELQASGLAGGVFENTLHYKLCGQGGKGGPDFVCGTIDNIMLTGIIQLNAKEMGDTGTFSITAPLSNGQWKYATLVVYCNSPANGEIQHAASQLIKNGP
jgi:hypothetical protein